MLSNGFTIYNKNSSLVKEYFKSLGCTMPSYKNPAELIIKAAISPQLLNLNIRIENLAERCKTLETETMKNIFDNANILNNKLSL